MASEVAEKLRKIGKLKPLSPPKIPKNKSVVLPDVDEELLEDSEKLVDDLGSAYFITYTKSDKSRSKRRITIKKINKNSAGNILLHCYCHERKAIRGFRADRIEEAVDLATGEVIVNFLAHLNNITGVEIHAIATPISDTAKALAESKHALNALVFLGRCDGELHPSEIDVICQYMMRNHFEVDFNEEELIGYIKRLYPDEDNFMSSITFLDERNELSKLVRFACQMIQADEIITEDEHRFIQEMQQYINIK